MNSHLKFGLYIASFLAVGYLTLHYLTDLLLPFIIALILAYLIEPMVKFLERRAKFSRNFSVITAILVAISLIGTLITLAVFKLYAEVISLSNILPQYYGKFSTQIINSLHNLEDFYLQLPPPIVEIIRHNISSLYAIFDSILKACLTPLASLPNFITILIISAIATYFISKDKEIICKFCSRLLPKSYQDKTNKALSEVVLAIINFIKAQTILVSITTIVATIGLLIIGIKYALLLGLLTGLFDFLPILGPSTIFLPWIFYHLIATADYALVIKVTIIYLVIMTIRQIAEPKIVGQAIGVHPLASLMAMYVGIKLIGVIGIIAGPLTLVIIKALIRAELLPKLPK